MVSALEEARIYGTSRPSATRSCETAADTPSVCGLPALRMETLGEVSLQAPQTIDEPADEEVDALSALELCRVALLHRLRKRLSGALPEMRAKHAALPLRLVLERDARRRTRLPIPRRAPVARAPACVPDA